ncbi:5-formyltetrahydrofolate cyclo-ligase [Bacillus sp. AGMB 02131]|uniref:5-formyltetrahydrofolate cyclo-ligase n=1 Tax=Peribacillus faecalis TaxID=2772559 RepID=A0A927CU74_9BACI|nr:5-formyltetrahydrofolate cyclo-ligase [Peribacillus faecalis]MBD3107653.1 5-formyltetrahydrofolate cyclo-ligase [Peribacillus faecalis]
MNKKKIRNETREKIISIPEEQFRQQCQFIHKRLFQSVEWLNSDCIAITISTKYEIDTVPIIEQAWAEGKKVAVPKCNPKDRKMTFRYLEHFNQLEKVYNDLQEPVEAFTRTAVMEELDLMIVPGIAFAPNGYRIGFGGGYYDRFLENYRGSTVSLLLPEQLYENIPYEPFDQPVQKLILPNGEMSIDD